VRTERGAFFRAASGNSDWYQVQGGDGFVVLQDPRDSRYVFSESQDGNIQRRNRITGEARNIRPNFANISPAPAEGQQPFRWNWDTPMVFSQHEQGALLVAANKVFRSNDRGDSWMVASPDLTTNADRTEIEIMGARGNQVRLSPNDGISQWPTIVSLAESPKTPGVYFTGTDDGVVSMTKDGGKTWGAESPTNFRDSRSGATSPKWCRRGSTRTPVYITVDGHRENDFKTYIWVSNDMGATFRSLNANLSGEGRAHDDRRHEEPGRALHRHRDRHLRDDRSRQELEALKGRNFPDRARGRDDHPPRATTRSSVGTHGRSLWILDHLEPIQEYAAAQAATTDARLYTPGPAMQYRMWDNQNDEFWGHRYFLGENPPADAVIQFALKKAVTDPKIKITDATGREVRELTIPANKNAAGIQTICWDMRVAPLGWRRGGRRDSPGAGGGQGTRRPGRWRAGRSGRVSRACRLRSREAVLTRSIRAAEVPGGGGGGGGFGGGGGGNNGPLVYPGTYTVALTIGGKVVDSKPMQGVRGSVSTDVAVEAKRYYDVAMDLHDMQRRSTEMANGAQPAQHRDDRARRQVVCVAGGRQGRSSIRRRRSSRRFARSSRLRLRLRAPAGGGGGGGRGRRRRDGADRLPGRLGSVKTLMMAFQDNPSPYVVNQYNDLKVSVPKAILDGNAVLTKGDVTQRRAEEEQRDAHCARTCEVRLITLPTSTTGRILVEDPAGSLSRGLLVGCTVRAERHRHARRVCAYSWRRRVDAGFGPGPAIVSIPATISPSSPAG
jgi:hypothetical protein